MVVLIVNIVINGDKGTLPVVGVDDVGLYVEMLHHFENGTGEESISFCVIVISVKTEIALEVILVINEIILNAVYGCGENAAIL